MTRIRYIATILLLGLFGVGCNSNSTDKQVVDSLGNVDPAAMMKGAVERGDWEEADKYTQRVIITRSDDHELMLLAAAVGAKCGRERESAHLVAEVARKSKFSPASHVDLAVRSLISVGEIYPAIELLESSLRTNPDQPQQRRMLVGFLAEVQRMERVPDHLIKLFQSRDFDFPLLIAMTENSTRRFSQKTVDAIFQRNPDDHRIRLANVFVSLRRGDLSKAAKTTEEILQHHPDFAPAHAMMGNILLQQQRWDDFAKWTQEVPGETRDFADYWLAIAGAAVENSDLEKAMRAYWEATQRDPRDVRAWDGLRITAARVSEGNNESAKSVSREQAQIITDYATLIHRFREQFNEAAAAAERDQSGSTKVAELLFQLGRTWEAEAWSAAATTLKKNPSADLADLRKSILSKLQSDSGWYSKTTPALALDLSHLPLPDIDLSKKIPNRQKIIPSDLSLARLKMSQRSKAWGLAGIGEGNNPDNAKLAPLIRSTGVGGGAIDYDLDGNSDLCMMNAGGSILKMDSKPNDLMRNVGNKFVRVTSPANVGDRSFGQGVAVGDFNEDGFPDLFFANLGVNRLYRNNGDGSFTDCTELLDSPSSEGWSTCGAFVDMNGDAISELFVTNYCKPVPSLKDACPNEEGVLGPCHPLKFPGDVDVLYSSTPEGRFQDVTANWIGQPVIGRGLGVVAGAISGDQFGLYVANDMSRNSFYSVNPKDNPKLLDTAASRGVAVDGVSRAQASMGIASSDFDLDGDLDFYVTGFGNEYNVMYEQVAPGLWNDRTSTLGLIEPTLMVIGFGAEAIDIDSDGIDEIMVTNGHIGEFDDPDIPQYDLPLQIFRRGATGKFELIDDDPWGDYFNDLHVGRALWTTDVNRDGRNDVMVTHTNEQVQLLLNESTVNNNRIGFRLIATDCSRDAVGAVMRFKVANKQRTLWMLSGDGYLCSNEKTLLAGLGEFNQVSEVTVTWQDGSVESFGDLPANSLYLLVQGQGVGFELQSYE